MGWIRRLRNTLLPENAIVEEEVRFHLERRAADLVERGIPPHQARQRVREGGGRGADDAPQPLRRGPDGVEVDQRRGHGGTLGPTGPVGLPLEGGDA